MSTNPLSRGELLKLALPRLLIGIVVVAVILFLPAWTFNYWEAWVFMAVLFLPVFVVGSWLLNNDPALLERRMRTREREAPQRLVIFLSLVWFILAFVIPGLDHRFGWSHIPTAVILGADALMLTGYLIVVSVFRENSYASRVVEVEQEQKVISSGPYAIVRHPMYIGTMIMYLCIPVALGSYWGILPALLIIPLLVVRIRNEETVLLKELSGYAEYTQKVRYRLVPGVW